MCSHHVPKLFPKFSMCSLKVFPISPDFNPRCLAQNPPLLTYIGGVFFARGIRPGKKIVTNSFAKRNFIQPMGRPDHALRMPWFFLLSLGAGGRGRFFFKLYLVWRVDCPVRVDSRLSILVLLGVGAGGFDFLSVICFSNFPCFPMCFH